jgi:hypothetical protein
MRTLIMMFTIVFSVNVFALSEVKLLRDFKIERASNADIMISKYNFQKDGDRCELILVANRSISSGVVVKSTVFNGIYVEQNECYFDFSKTCKFGLSASNNAYDLDLSLTCWNKGFFARELDAVKVNQILMDALVLE